MWLLGIGGYGFNLQVNLYLNGLAFLSVATVAFRQPSAMDGDGRLR